MTALDDDLFDEPGEVIRGAFRCERPSRYAGWLLADGTVVPARCGATNKCAYCAYRRVLEDALVVNLDADEYGHPRVGMTLTTVDPDHDLKQFSRDVAKLFEMVRRRLGREVAYLGMMEWTTGRGERSGGRRRAHQHLLLKYCLPSEAEALEPHVRDFWERRTGASRVELRELRSPAGATAYLIHHHRKRDQAPPPGFTGKRFRPSQGYFAQPIAELRAEAHALLRNKRLRRAARRLVDWEYADQAPEAFDLEWDRALAEARHDAAMVTFVKLSHRGYITSFTRTAGRPSAGRAPHIDDFRGAWRDTA